MKKETIGLVLFIGGAAFVMLMTWGLINMLFNGSLEFSSASLLAVVTQLFWIAVGIAAFFIGKDLKD